MERHSRAVVAVRIVGIVSIELELIVVEVEIRVVRPLAVGVPDIAFYLSLSPRTKIVVSLYFI